MNPPTTLKTTLAATLALAANLSFADTFVPEYDRASIHVGSGQTQAVGPLTVAGEARFVKTGAGTATLAKEDLISPNAPHLDVLEGRFEISANGTPAAVTPPTAILNTATVWLAADAGMAHFVTSTSGDETMVDVWRDVRDTDASVTNYPYAATPLSSSHGLKSPTIATVDGRQCLNFGGFGSKRTMWFRESGSKKKISAVTVFAVTKITNGTGHLLGNASNTHPYEIGAWGSGSLASPYYTTAVMKSPHMRTLRFFDNGERRDVGRDWPKTGLRIYEWCHSARAAGSFDALFTQSDGWVARQGGGNLMEFVAFGSELSEGDRLAVERYLAAKWGVPLAANVRVAADASVSVAAAGMTVRPSGEGLVEAAAADLMFEAGEAPVFGGEVKLAAGVPSKIYGPGIPLALASGDSINVVRANNTTDFGRETATLTKTAPAGTVEKTGTGTARVTALPDGVTKLNVKGGQLVLAAPVADAMPAALGSGISATIANGDFESSDMSAWALTGDGNQGRFKRVSGVWGDWKCDFSAPQGEYVLCLKGSSTSAENTNVTVPVDGRYDLSFFGCGRSGFEFGTYNVKFTSGTTIVDCGTIDPVHVPYYGGYRKFHVLTPELTAGTWTMRIEPNFDTGDVTTTLDDFRLELVTENVDADGAWPLPNGGFENLDFNGAHKNKVWSSSLGDPELSASNSVSSWTFNGGGASPVPAAGLVEESMFFFKATSASGATSYANPALVRYGKKCAGFWSNAGSVTSAVFTPPPGVWQVRFKAATGGNGSSAFWNGSALSDYPAWRVVVGVNGTTALDSASTGSAFGHNTWHMVQPDGAFTVAPGDSVTVSISQTLATAAGYIDDVELVPANFVANGGFETGNRTGWGASGSNPLANVGGYSSNTGNFGLDICDGTYRMQLEGAMALAQTLHLPAAGLYRIRFHARTRTGDRRFAQVVVTLSSDEATNTIARINVDTDTFHAYDYWVSIPAAGDYTLSIGGVITDSPDRNTLIDDVSVIKCDGGLASDTPSVSRKMALEVASGATVALDFPGTLELDSLWLGGRSAHSGVFSAATHPDYLVGAGSIFVKPKGFVLFMR